METQAAATTEAASTMLPAAEAVVRPATAGVARARSRRRDSARRRALAFADCAAVILAYLLVWAVDPPGTRWKREGGTVPVRSTA